jgi:site-specific DNA-methyltransferase (adenine-specific)
MLDLNKIYNVNCLNGLQLLDDNSIDCVITSPPYNVGIKYSDWNDELPWSEYLDFMQSVFNAIRRVLRADGRLAINIPYDVNLHERGSRKSLLCEFYNILHNANLNYTANVLLYENTPERAKQTAWGSWLSSSSPYIYNNFECVMLGYKEQWNKISKGTSYFTDSPEHKKEFMQLVSGKWLYSPETSGLTKANFSLDIPLNALKILTYENDIILDPFIGSGTTAIACRQLNRNYIGFEISKEYYDIAYHRLSSDNQIDNIVLNEFFE